MPQPSKGDPVTGADGDLTRPSRRSWWPSGNDPRSHDPSPTAIPPTPNDPRDRRPTGLRHQPRDRASASQPQRRPATPSPNPPTTDIRPSKATPRLGRNSRSSPSPAIEGKPARASRDQRAKPAPTHRSFAVCGPGLPAKVLTSQGFNRNRGQSHRRPANFEPPPKR